MIRLCLMGLLSLAALTAFAQAVSAADTPPNIVLIVVDDAGLMDFGGYGGEAKTPTINEIADAGVRFSNYHSSPLCAPSRAMLLTGVDNHQTGVATIREMANDEQAEKLGYAMHLVDGVLTVADKLRNSGYRTLMTGKWHLGSGPGELPDSHGFDRSFTLDASGADNFEQKSYLPFYEYAPWFEDGEPADLPENFYSSKFIIDKMLEYLDEGETQKPFFSYIAFQAIHIPVQAPREFIDNYEGVYTGGWNELLQRRFENAKALGLIADDVEPPELHSTLRPWDSLTEDEQHWYERAMMVNAGMLEAMDLHIGRLVEHLKQAGQFENTVFFITSDNGPEFNIPMAATAFNPSLNVAAYRYWMRQNGYNDDIETLGEKGSMVAIGPEWASAASSPSSLFKFYAAEGGTRVPLIVSGPGIEAAGFNGGRSFVTDVAPTILSLAGVSKEVFESGVSMVGKSLEPLLDQSIPEVYADDIAIGFEVSGNSAVFKGEYKLTRNTLPHGDGTWGLYHLPSDPAERLDLSSTKPTLRAEMLADYDAYSREMDVAELGADFDAVARVTANVSEKGLQAYTDTLIVLLIGLMLAGIVIGIWISRRKSRSKA